MDCSLPGFSIHGIFQAGVLEWVAISFFKAFTYTQVISTTAKPMPSQAWFCYQWQFLEMILVGFKTSLKKSYTFIF